MPMVSTFTPPVRYIEINVKESDLFEDAWGFKSEFHDVLSQLCEPDTSACNSMAEKLIGALREMNQ
jgi:hypothetical protein